MVAPNCLIPCTCVQVPEVFWASSLIFVGNGPSFTDESGRAELWQLDTTGMDAAKTQLE